MPVDPLQIKVVEILKTRRSENSLSGFSRIVNETCPQRPDNIDIHVEDANSADIARADIKALRKAGLTVTVNDRYESFATEAIVQHGKARTLLEWSEADRSRFFPIQPHRTFGWALHEADLAVQKLVAGASRRKVRDMVDIMLIDKRCLSLAAAAIAAPGKMPGASPIAILERARQIAIGHPVEELEELRLDQALDLPSVGDMKFAFADRVQEVIDLIIRDCWEAEPGNLYLDLGAKRLQIPQNSDLPSLTKHAATERGTVPFIQGALQRRTLEFGD